MGLFGIAELIWDYREGGRKNTCVCIKYLNTKIFVLISQKIKQTNDWIW